MENKTKKGLCTQSSGFYGLITVSEKGQIAIPIGARNDLDIKTGDRLLVLKKKDGSGLLLVKQDLLNKFLDTIKE